MSNNDIIDYIILPKIGIINSSEGNCRMKIKSIDIKGVGGIINLQLNFNNGFNVICGTNGIGKTTILETIITGFSSSEVKLKRNFLCENGSVDLIYTKDKNERDMKHIKYQVKHWGASIESDGTIRGVDDYNGILYFKSLRQIEYVALPGVMKDRSETKWEILTKSVNGIDSKDIKSWFVNRDLYITKENSLSEEQRNNYNEAVKCFQIMDPKIKFKYVDASTLEIILDTPKGDIYFEYLSAGYKSSIYILLGIIKEIEVRNTNPRIKINEFEGVVLIDEIDLHLHPYWQAQLVIALKKLLPKAQIISTTHSPSILQVLEKDEIIALEDDKKNGVKVKELNLGKYGLQGWTLEEILSDVMGVPSTSSDKFLESINQFDKAIYEEDSNRISKYFKVLDEMLHPNSTLRKLLEIQMAGMEE